MEKFLRSHHQNHYACLIPLQNKQCSLLIKIHLLSFTPLIPTVSYKITCKTPGMTELLCQSFKPRTGLEAAAPKSKYTPSSATHTLQQSPLGFSIKSKLEIPWILNPWSAGTSAGGTAFAHVRDPQGPRQPPAVTKRQNIWACFGAEATRLFQETWNHFGFYKGLLTYSIFQLKISKKNFSLIEHKANSFVMAQAL